MLFVMRIFFIVTNLQIQTNTHIHIHTDTHTYFIHLASFYLPVIVPGTAYV